MEGSGRATYVLLIHLCLLLVLLLDGEEQEREQSAQIPHGLFFYRLLLRNPQTPNISGTRRIPNKVKS